MTKFEVLKGITGVAEFSRLVLDMTEKASSVEDLEKDLRTEIPQPGMEIIKSIAVSGNYPLSLDGMDTIDQTIKAVCEWIQKVLKENAVDSTAFSAAISALAELVTAKAKLNQG